MANTNADLSALLKRYQDYNSIRCSIDDVNFYINPTSFEMITEPLFYEVPTLDGYARFDFGMRPYIYRLEGFTGNGGVYELDNSTKMRKFRPEFNKSKVVHTFRYPARLNGPRTVFINSFEDSITSQSPYYNYYRIEMVEYPPGATSYIKQSAPNTNYQYPTKAL